MARCSHAWACQHRMRWALSWGRRSVLEARAETPATDPVPLDAPESSRPVALLPATVIAFALSWRGAGSCPEDAAPSALLLPVVVLGWAGSGAEPWGGGGVPLETLLFFTKGNKTTAATCCVSVVSGGSTRSFAHRHLLHTSVTVPQEASQDGAVVQPQRGAWGQAWPQPESTTQTTPSMGTG